MSLISSGKLSPWPWVQALAKLGSAELEGDPFGALLLVVRVPEDDDTGQFLNHLVASVVREVNPIQLPPQWPTTGQFPTMHAPRGEFSEADQVELLSELGSAPHCMIPLRTPRDDGSLVLGRAESADIQLSDPSVSSTHAKLLLGEGGAQIMDNGSKNGTTVNGRRLSPHECLWLQPMDRLMFGRIRAFACDPRVLRMVIKQEIRSLLE